MNEKEGETAESRIISKQEYLKLKEDFMQNNRGLKILGLVAIVALAFVFLGFNLVQGQVTTKGKPDKPPGKDDETEYAWSSDILDGPFSIQGRGETTYNGLGGNGTLYDSSEGNINITNVVKVISPKNPHQVNTNFTLEVFYPVGSETLFQIDFLNDYIGNQEAFFDENIFTDDWPPIKQELNPDLTYKYLGFPMWASATEHPLDEGRIAREIFDFLCNVNGHPYGPGVPGGDYYKVRLKFSSAWADSLEGGTYDSWVIGDEKPMGYGGENGNLSIEGQNMARRHCDHGDFDVWNYHNIVGDQHFIPEDDEWGAGWPGYIVRISDNIWKVVVDGKINIYEEYCECVVERANSNRPIRTWLTRVRPIYGTCDMQFEMLFIRTKL